MLRTHDRFRHGFIPPRVLVLLALFALPACSGGGDGAANLKFITLGTAPTGGAFNPVGAEIAETLNKNKGDSNWEVQASATSGSQENIRKLTDGELQIALSNAAITYSAVRGTESWDKKYPVQAVVTMAPNVAMFITKEESGIRTIADLKGKRVICGPAGAGFEMFLRPILEAHGLSFDDFNKLNAVQSEAVERLADDNADAAFLGGAVPTGAIVQACSSHNIHFIPYDEAAKEQLIEEYPYFQGWTVPQEKYSDLKGPYEGLNVGSMHLITAADQPEDLIYQITKTIWENREQINHPAAKFISEENAARYTGVDFHPGAIKFYKEIGIWKEPGAEDAAETADAQDDQGGQDAT